jgi:hypothetical protein
VLDPVTPMVGRDREARTLRWAWRQARAGHGTAIAIVGPHGIGKTRLAAEAAVLPASQGADIYYASCAEDTDDDVAAIVAKVATQGLSLVVVDDADAAGPASIDALSGVAGTLGDTSTLLIVAFHEQEGSAHLRRAVRELTDADPIRPGPLNLEQVRQIASMYFGRAADALQTASLEATGGIPRSVHEFVGTWAQEEASRRLGDAASRAALGRSGLRSVESELAGSVVDLQIVQEQVRLFGVGVPDRGTRRTRPLPTRAWPRSS